MVATSSSGLKAIVLLGMDANSLSDADSAVLNTGYIVQIDDAPASCSSVQQLQSKVELISPSVVNDEEGWCRK